MTQCHVIKKYLPSDHRRVLQAIQSLSFGIIGIVHCSSQPISLETLIIILLVHFRARTNDFGSFTDAIEVA